MNSNATLAEMFLVQLGVALQIAVAKGNMELVNQLAADAEGYSKKTDEEKMACYRAIRLFIQDAVNHPEDNGDFVVSLFEGIEDLSAVISLCSEQDARYWIPDGCYPSFATLEIAREHIATYLANKDTVLIPDNFKIYDRKNKEYLPVCA